MKKFSKILVFALSLLIAVSAFAIAASAESSPFLVEGLYRESWEEAVDNAYIESGRDIPVLLLTDCTSNGESVEINKSVRISLNGKTLTVDETLFTVVGKDTVLTIEGPGTINVGASFVNLEEGKLVLDATNGMTVNINEDCSAFVAGNETKAEIELKGELKVVNKTGGSLFEITSGSKFMMNKGASVVANPKDATDPFYIVNLTGTSSLEITDASITNNGGYIFNVSAEEEGSLASIKCDGATLISESQTFGGIAVLGASYADVNIRCSTIVASGSAFIGPDNLSDYDGDGKDKIYKKPNAKIVITACDYAVGGVINETATIFNGNLTGIISSSKLTLSLKSTISLGTRLWDGECGVLLKSGTILNVLAKSEITEPLKDEDGAKMHFSPDSNTNKNFSCQDMEGAACDVYRVQKLDENHKVYEYYVVSKENVTNNFDPQYMNDLESAETGYAELNGPSFSFRDYVIAEQSNILNSYGSLGIYETVNEATNESNKFFQYEYDASKKDNYTYTNSSNTYLDMYFGTGNGLRKDATYSQIVANKYATIDFDIATQNGNYPWCTMRIYQRVSTLGPSATANYQYCDRGDNTAAISDNVFSFGGGSYALPTDKSWAHITFVIDIDSSGEYVDTATKKSFYPNLYLSEIHSYVDGNYVGTALAYTDKLREDLIVTSEVGIGALRFNFKPSKSFSDKDKSTSLCIDNIATNYYNRAYNGTLTDVIADKTRNLKESYDAVYNVDYKVPFSTAVEEHIAIVDGIKYYSVADAVNAISEGSEAEFFCDVESFNATQSFTVKTKYKFNVSSDSHFVSEIIEDGEVVGYRIMPANRYVTIFWQIGAGYTTEVPIGVSPTYNGILPIGYEIKNGKRIEFIGWSTRNDATEPDADVLPVITRDDIARGYRIYYPVYNATEVEVSFHDKDGNVIDKQWVPYGTDASELVNYNDGSTLQREKINDLYSKSFGFWSFEDGITTVGREPLKAYPNFTGIYITDIKYSYSIQKLITVSPIIYVGDPGTKYPEVELLHFTIEGNKDEKGNDIIYNSFESVTVGESAYKRLDLSSKYAGNETVESFDKASLVMYLHFTYKGEALVQKVTLDFSGYLEACLEKAISAKNENSIKALMETVRLADSYLRYAELETLPVCTKYLNDKSLSGYLTDLSKVSTTLISETTRATANSNLYGEDGFDKHIDKISWTFKTNSIKITPNAKKYPKLQVGHKPYTNTFLHAQVTGNNRIPTSLDDARTFSVDIEGTSYGVKTLSIFDVIPMRFEEPNSEATGRNSVFNKNYSFASHIIWLENLIKDNPSYASELEVARAIYSAHYAYKQIDAENDGKFFSFSNLWAE